MNRPNIACQILDAIGVANVGTPQSGPTSNPSFTKAGPGRRPKQGDGTHRTLSLRQRRAGAYGRGLRNWIASTQAAAQANKRAARMERAIA